jgi:hypothetical protein
VKRHLTLAVAGAVLFVAGVLSIGFIGWWTMPLGLMVIAGAWLGGRCWHRDISLLPPVPGAGADREYARWHCNGCGATWAAGLESSTRPRPLYSGYDQSKAEQAAARANTLERERRRLAVERAGLSKTAPVTAADTGTATLTRVAGGRVRRLSVDAAAPDLDEGRLAHRRADDDLPRIRSLRG